MKLVIELIIIFAVMYVALLILVGRGPKKKHKSEWVSKENYEHFLKTGDRRFLYEKDYKKRGYNDFD